MVLLRLNKIVEALCKSDEVCGVMMPVMLRFDDDEWMKFLVMYEQTDVKAKAVFAKARIFGEPFKVLRGSGLRLLGAALRDDTVDARAADYTRAVLAIGSEGRGLSDEVLALCDETVRIPMSPRCESLNAAVAASVLLWEAYR